jgi:hypothetical protein
MNLHVLQKAENPLTSLASISVSMWTLIHDDDQRNELSGLIIIVEYLGQMSDY